MKKIGIVSCYFKDNYGSMLQAYATQKKLNDFNLENETFNIDQNIDFKLGKKKFYKSQITNIKFIKSKFGMLKLRFYKRINKKLNKNILKRKMKFKEFRKEINLTKPFLTYNELNEASKKYSSIIVGSDQLWLPVNVVSDYYTLNWVQNNVNKVSYSTSFGISKIPNKYQELYKKFLKRINKISVREQDGCKIVKNLIGKEATMVCDPTMLLTKEEWEKIQDEKPIVEGKYILCYFLGKNIYHRKFAEKIKEKTGYKIVSLNHCDEYVKYSDKFADIIPYDIGPKEFLNLIKNAEYICTDSFHGTVFSIINNKKFFTFERYNNKNGKISTNSRIYSLLEKMKLQDRILNGKENIEDIINRKINYKEVNEKLNEFRTESEKFLKEALEDSIKIQKENDKVKSIVIDDKSKCCGCTACKNICPVNAIVMKEDKEGFLYPVIDYAKCTNCGLCKKTCPIINSKIEKKEQQGFIVNNKDSYIRKNSTSGGAFTPIANYILNRNGLVFGAAFNENNEVEHKYVDKTQDLSIFRGSKYVQSNLGNTFKLVKDFLEQDRYVCFSGTPCQIEGLNKFLKKNYEKLITVDIMCHAVPSPLVWKKYKNYIQKYKLNNEKINKILFRDKGKYGYKYSCMTITSENKEYSKGIETDPYLRAFFGDLSDRPSCYNCSFKKQYHESDFTIWDCFITENFDKKLDDDKGTSRMLLNTKKAKMIFDTIKKEFDYREIEVEQLVNGVKEMTDSVKMPLKRAEFFNDIIELEDKKVFEKYFPENLKTRIKRIIRITLAKTKLYKPVKKFAKKILRK